MPRTSLMQVVGGVAATATRVTRQLAPRPGPLRWRHTDGFYERCPEPGEGPMGEVLTSEPMSVYLLPGLKVKADAWRILYRSSNLDGTATGVSGTIVVPRHRPVRAVIGYAPGTHGLANYAAPSRLMARGLDYETPFVAAMVSRGYAVAVTDYEGLGTPGDHPYVIGRSIGRNVLDVIRAALDFDEVDLPDDVPLGVFGYSEGGHAAAWAAELHPTYAPELELAGVVAGSVPADLESAGDYIEGGPFSFFAGFGALGVNAAYPELNLDQYLTPEGHKHMYRLRRSSVVTAALRGPHFVGVDTLMSENVLRRPDWQARLRENAPGTDAPIAPVYLFTSTLDPIVPPVQTKLLAERWLDLGVDVQITFVPAIDHITGLLMGAPAGLKWLEEQVGAHAAGRRQPRLRILRGA